MKANVTFTAADVINVSSVVSAGNSAIGRAIPTSQDAVDSLLQALQDLREGKIDQIVIRKEDDADED